MADDIPRIIASALAEEPSVVAVYLHGSRATGRARPDSDWDVAVLLDHDPCPGTFAVEARLLDRIRARLRGVRIDLAALNGSSLLFQEQVFRGGRVLFERDRNARTGHEAAVWNQWCDFKPYRDRMIREMYERLQNGTYGRAQ